MSKKSKRFHLVFFIRGLSDQVVFEVAEEVSDWLSAEIEGLCSADSTAKVHQFDTVDGQSVSINFEFVQSVRFLWEPAFIASEGDEYDGAIRIWRRGVDDPIEASYDDPVQVYDFYTNVGFGTSVVPCPSFVDEDGELLVLNAKELLYMVVPTEAVHEGQSTVLAEAVVEDAKNPPKLKVVKQARKKASKKVD